MRMLMPADSLAEIMSQLLERRVQGGFPIGSDLFVTARRLLRHKAVGGVSLCHDMEAVAVGQEDRQSLRANVNPEKSGNDVTASVATASRRRAGSCRHALS